jgi:hypothetical protein
MGCCGRARDAVRQEYASVTPEAAPARPLQPGAAIRYLGRSPILIRGPLTGRAWTFRPGEPDQLVDPHDAEVLVRTGLFRRTGPGPNL